MTALENLNAAVNDLRMMVGAATDRIQNLTQTLANAHADSADAATIEQLSAELQSATDQLRSALVASAQAQPHV